MNTFDRRRVAVACAVTVVALLTLWVFSNRNAENSAPLPSDTAIGSDTAPPTSAYQPEDPLFVGGAEQPTPPEVINVAVPPAPGANQTLARASFKRYAGVGTSVCTTLLAPDNTMLKVTNLDNGQTTSCMNTLGVSLPAGSDLVMNTAVYILIADLAEAPVPVRVSW